MPSLYQCPRHGCDLVARVLVSRRVTQDNYKGDCETDSAGILYRGTWISWAEYTKLKYAYRFFVCPATGCDFKKPDKWAHRRKYGEREE